MEHAQTLTAPRRSAGLLGTLRRWQDIARSRAHLKALDAHALRDVGISLDEARAEASRAFWDAPRHWCR